MGRRFSGLFSGSLCSAVNVLLVKNFTNSGGSSLASMMSINRMSFGRCMSPPCIFVLNSRLRQSVDWRFSGLFSGSLCSAVNVLLVKNFTNSGGSSLASMMSINRMSFGRCMSPPCIFVLNSRLRQSVDSAAGPVALPFCKYDTLKRIRYVSVNFSNSALIESTVWFCKCSGVCVEWLPSMSSELSELVVS